MAEQDGKKQGSLPVSGGYPKEIFKSGFDTKFLCNHCSKILRDPVQSYCGHRFCRKCIEGIVSAGDQVQCQTCLAEGVEEEDYSLLKTDQIFPDNAVKREMSSMETTCPNTRCDWTGKFKGLEPHLDSCKFKTMPCPLCSEMVEMSKLVDHQKNECQARNIICKHCEEEMPLKDEPEHLKNCPKVQIKCDACGKKKIPRDKLQEHIDEECANQKVNCPVGCEPIDRGSFISHIEKKPGQHIQWLLMRTKELIEKTDKKIDAVMAAREEGNRAEIARLTQFIQSLQLKVADLDKQTKQLMDQRTERGSTASSGDLTRVGKQCDSLELKIGTFEGIVTTLYREIERCVSGMEQVDIARRNDREKMEEMERKIKQYERTSSLREVSMSEHDMRLRALEVVSYDGTLVWRIDEWSKHRREATAMKTTSIYSPHFYTNRTGYRLCARLYPNGDGMGKGTHLSVFFVVVRGNYDALLSWPFGHRVTFMLLDQNNREHIIDSFRPDPTSNSFKRPTTDMNIASGCPLFMPLPKLEEPSAAYVKDDVMFIKIIVEPPR